MIPCIACFVLAFVGTYYIVRTHVVPRNGYTGTMPIIANLALVIAAGIIVLWPEMQHTGQVDGLLAILWLAGITTAILWALIPTVPKHEAIAALSVFDTD